MSFLSLKIVKYSSCLVEPLATARAAEAGAVVTLVPEPQALAKDHLARKLIISKSKFPPYLLAALALLPELGDVASLDTRVNIRSKWRKK